ncbi:hypothetical protein G5V58_16870 [Nocardioides anomalus]|uniref:Uncharacterized protein n=1 Tax=Nocardioides anomalus TaxID=2712223 RepID=A0A6G6WGD7_9ACTN|nr:hypothetical protein [Nocardioides anomalus]QIG44223.1 hypothetical protein G5V58_16870 [Nocardioides anomalus]
MSTTATAPTASAAPPEHEATEPTGPPGSSDPPLVKVHRAEVSIDGTAWTVEATSTDGRLAVEVLAASETDGTVAVQLCLDGDKSHLELLEDVTRELQSRICGRPARRRPGPYGLAAIRTRIPRAYEPWTDTDEHLLLERWDAGATIDDLALVLERGPRGIRSRLIKLGRIEEAS